MIVSSRGNGLTIPNKTVEFFSGLKNVFQNLSIIFMRIYIGTLSFKKILIIYKIPVK